ncbi:unnamed protein product [Leptidea sinapis]|uniref:Homeobox domain-containing protein n=1 Tax=Leptidea sinapis TaxID=189913 RepID=A0A5E4PTL2_9NEOP|nr:unnamed protein product [Leptidea sinapis]
MTANINIYSPLNKQNVWPQSNCTSNLQKFYQNFNPENAEEIQFSYASSTSESPTSCDEFSSYNNDFGTDTCLMVSNVFNHNQESGVFHNNYCNITPCRKYVVPVTTQYTSNAQIKRTIKKRDKRKRTAFTTEQIITMEKIFKTRPYICPEERINLSEKLKISEKSIKIWFQNRRRTTEKRDQPYSPDSPISEDMSDTKFDRLSYLEMMINERVDHFGNVALDDEVMTELVSIIDDYIPKETQLVLETEVPQETEIIMY